MQGFVYLALIYLQGFTTKQMVNPWKTYVKLSAVLMGSHGLTKGSLAFLNYPAQIMFKSTKACVHSGNPVEIFNEMFRFCHFRLTLLLCKTLGASCYDNGSLHSWVEKEIPSS